MKLRLHLGQRQAEIHQTYQTLGRVVADAFGNDSGPSKKPEGDEVKKPQTEAEMQSAFASVFGV